MPDDTSSRGRAATEGFRGETGSERGRARSLAALGMK
jgi:hypothetical protein